MALLVSPSPTLNIDASLQRKSISKLHVSHRFISLASLRNARTHQLRAVATTTTGAQSPDKEEVYFDGGPHYGDLVANLIFGFTLFWLPLTLAAVLRALFLRYRFTSYRVTILSGLTGGDRKDFKYDVIKDVKYVPRFIGEWGDLVITLKDDTKVELKSLPYFREVAKLCLEKAGKAEEASKLMDSEKTKKKGFL